MKLHDLRLGGTTIAALLLATAGVAAAQPAPAPTAPIEPPVGDVAPPADPSAPPVEGANDPVEPTPDAAPEPAVALEAPAPAPAKGGSPVNVSYDKGLTFASDDEAFHLKITFRNQIRFETIRKTDDGEELESHFLIPRSRLQAEGNVFGKGNRYKLEFGLGDAGSFSFVKDLFIDKKLATGLWLRGGQWKRPFNRQELVSDFASEFNERAITADFVGGGRDLGIALHNDYEKSPDGLEWTVGVFNGFNGGADRPRLATTCTADPDTGVITCANGRPTTFPDDFGPTVAGRVGWNMGGIKGYSEGDLEGGPLRLAVGVSYKVDLANLEEGAEDSTADNLSHGAQADVMLKVEGLSFLGAVYLMKLKSADAMLGGLVQAGYFLAPKKAQIAGRFAMHQTATDDLNEIEARAAFNWFFQGHAWKLATDIGFLDAIGDAADEDPEIQGRVMAQLTL